MKRHAVIFIHGIGDQSDGFSMAMEDKLRKLIPDQIDDRGGESDPEPPVFREALWAKVTSGPQTELWKRVRRSHDLDLVKLRKFFVTFGGDAVAYQLDGDQDVVYSAVTAVVQEQLDSIHLEFPNDKFEYTFIAHSLGTIVVSNFLYDQSKANGIKATNLFTLGSPLAIWTLRYGGPTKATSPAKVARPNGAWINILDDEDIIGYPLRDLNQQYKAAVDMDYVTEIGGLISMGNPLSHVGYWTDRNVLKPISRKLAIDYLRIHQGIPFKKAAYLKYIRKLWSVG